MAAPAKPHTQTATPEASESECRPTGDALRVSEVRYRRLFESARDGILILDADTGVIADVNPFLADLLGYATQEVVGKALWELGPFKDKWASQAAFRELQAQDYIRYDDLPLEAKDGRSIAVEFVSNVYVADDKKVIQCNIRDITERKSVEKNRRTSDERYRTLFESAPDGILIADLAGCYVDANASICRMLGYARDELVGLNAADIVVPDEVPRISKALAAIVGGSEYHQEWQFRRKDASVFSADVFATVIPGGNLLAMIRDVTERDRSERAVRTAEERMRFALESAHIGIWDMDCVSGAVQWSEVLETQYGLPPGTFGGTYEAFVERIHPEDRASVSEAIGRAMKSGSDFSVLHRTIRPDGTVRWLSGGGRIVLGEDGQPARAIGISQDVTERRALEAQVQQTQKMEAIGLLAGGVAHDFNNLLTIILGFCEMLLSDLPPDDPRYQDLTEIQTAGTQAAQLTRQLLAFSRTQIIEPALLDLSAIVTEIRPMLRRLIKEDIKLLIGVEPRLPLVQADRGQVEQVILNLAVNGQDAMPRGGTLTIETAKVDLDEHYAATHVGVQPGPHVVLTVTDSGTGMTPEVREHLFEPFFTTKEVGKGTGLGLATVHGIATRSGGSVNVYTELGRGTSFKVYFPQAAPVDTVVQVPVTTAPPTGTETVLLVEDADGLRELTKRLLERLGYTVVAAASTQDALRQFEEHPSIDLLLTDVVMPGGGGADLAQQLSARSHALKVLYMSGYTDDAIVQHGVLKPGIAFLQKPFTADALGRKVRDVLDR